MKKSVWLLLFTASLVADLSGVYYQDDVVIYCAKPLIVISLLGWLMSHRAAMPKAFLVPVTTALACSLAGDVLLMFDKYFAFFFIAGLVCFLVAHLFYIVCFNRLRLAVPQSFRLWLIPAVITYYCTLVIILFPFLGSLQLPVIVYGAVITSMLYVALHLLFSPAVHLKLVALGALLFVVSDSLLAFNKFYQSFPYAGILIMLSYGLAQYCIVTGVVGNFTRSGSISKQAVKTEALHF